MSEHEGLPEDASTVWWQLVDETEGTAEGYRDRGWAATVVHPGDVTAVNQPDYFGLSVLVPDSEYETVRSLVEDHTFGRSRLFRRSDGNLHLFLCVFEATGDEAAVLVPVYLAERDVDLLFTPAREAGEMPVHVRPLEYEQRATLTVADPGMFFESGD